VIFLTCVVNGLSLGAFGALVGEKKNCPINKEQLNERFAKWL